MIYQPNPILYLRLPFYAQHTHSSCCRLCSTVYSINTLYSVSLTAVYALQYQPMHPTLYLLLHTVHIVSFIILSLKSAHFIRNNVRFKVIVHLLNYIMRRPKIILHGTIHFWWQDVGPSLATFLPNLNTLMQVLPGIAII